MRNIDLAKSVKDIGSQLEHKADLNEVFLKNNGININNFDEETRKTFLELQGIDVNYVLGLKNVKEENLADNLIPYFLDDVSIEMNLINNSKLEVGGLLNTGIVDKSNIYNRTTDYIPVSPNTKIYRKNTNPVVIGYYDENKMFIRRDTINIDSFIIIENCKFIRYASSSENVTSEVLSLYPVKYYTSYNINPKYKLGNKYYIAPAKNTVSRNILTNNFLDLNLNKFLGDTDNLNDYTNDGIFIGINSINSPNTGTFVYENRAIKNGSEVRWVLQKATNLNDLKEVYERKIDIINNSNNTNWVNRQQNIENKFKGKTIVFLGDSITQGVGATNETIKGYVGVLKTKYGINTINKGKAGATMANYNDGYDDISVLSQIANTDFTNIDYVVIFIGTNDFGRGNTGRVIGNVDSVNTSEFTGGLNIGIKNILEANPKIKILLVTPMWRQRLAANDNKDSDIYPYDGKYLKDYVNAMIEVGKINHIPVKNLYDECLINKYNYSAYLTDGLHPNDYGHEYLADVIYSSLNSVY